MKTPDREKLNFRRDTDLVNHQFFVGRVRLTASDQHSVTHRATVTGPTAEVTAIHAARINAPGGRSCRGCVEPSEPVESGQRSSLLRGCKWCRYRRLIVIESNPVDGISDRLGIRDDLMATSRRILIDYRHIGIGIRRSRSRQIASNHLRTLVPGNGFLFGDCLHSSNKSGRECHRTGNAALRADRVCYRGKICVQRCTVYEFVKRHQ